MNRPWSVFELRWHMRHYKDSAFWFGKRLWLELYKRRVIRFLRLFKPGKPIFSVTHIGPKFHPEWAFNKAEWSQDDIKALRPGDKLIFISNSGVLTGKPGDVVTFRGLPVDSVHKRDQWAYDDNKIVTHYRYFQCQELIDQGYLTHSFDFGTVMPFDAAKYPNHRPLTAEIMDRERSEFIKKYGS
jgi:hypothetical protein